MESGEVVILMKSALKLSFVEHFVSTMRSASRVYIHFLSFTTTYKHLS